jgi:PAS domain S-box-containing protein
MTESLQGRGDLFPPSVDVPALMPGSSTLAPAAAGSPIAASQDLHRLLVEHSLGLICTHDLTGTLLLVNRAAARALGYVPDAGVGRNLREFLAPDARGLFDGYLQRMRDQGQDAGLMRVLSRDGDERIWMYRNIRFDEAGREPYVLGHALDVTERIGAERALRESEQALLRAHAEMEARVRERTAALQHANERLVAEILERRRAEETRERALVHERDTLGFLGEVSLQLTPLVDRDGVLAALQQLPVPFLADWTLVFLADDDGGVRCIGGTHLAPEQDAALAALATAATGTVAADCMLARAIASGRPELIAGDPDGVSTGFLGSPLAALVRQLGARALLVVPVRSGGHVVAAIALASLTDTRFSASDVAIAQDLAARVSTALDRVKLYHDAQEANRLKDEFMSILSHELRTPLNAILGWSRILRMGGLEGRTEKAVEVIERNAEAQARLIDEILDTSRIVTGKLRLTLAPVRLEAVVRAALDAIRPAAGGKGIRIEEHVEPGLPTVTGDAHRLQQVLSNLLANALKFTGPDGTISVSLHAAGGELDLVVADTGVGIRREVLPFVFDRFRQADSSTSRRHGGLGLGLAIVRHIVELHGGSVSAHSAGQGQGARFVVRLPVGSVHAAGSAGAPRTPEPRSRALEPRLRGRRVLVVEDDPDARHFVSVVLEASGASVVTAATAVEALDEMSRATPDVIVADIGLPGEDGYTLVRRIRQLPPDRGGTVPAVALTAYARAEDREAALAAGFDRHLVKPVDPVALATAVAEIVGAERD